MGRELYSVKVKSVEQLDSYLNGRGLMFGFRTEEINLTAGGVHYVSFDVPDKKKMQLHHRAIQGRGLGSLEVTAIGGTDEVVGDIGTFRLYQDIGKPIVDSGIKVYSGAVANGGVISTFEPSIIYVGDETAITAARTQSEAELPIINIERIFNNNSGERYGVGFKFELSSTNNSVFNGYIEIYFTVEDAD